jgi:hypothetical protein
LFGGSRKLDCELEKHVEAGQQQHAQTGRVDQGYPVDVEHQGRDRPRFFLGRNEKLLKFGILREGERIGDARRELIARQDQGAG